MCLISDGNDAGRVACGVVNSDGRGILPAIDFSGVDEKRLVSYNADCRCVGVTVEDRVVLTAAGCLNGGARQVAEKELPPIQFKRGLCAVQGCLRTLCSHARKTGAFVLIVAENQINGVGPFFAQGAESGQLRHIPHEQQVGAPLLLCCMQSQQQVGVVIMDI